MGIPKATFQDLQSEIEEFRTRHPVLKDDNLFILWFLRACITESETDAADALTGGPYDKGVDAVFFDSNTKSTFIIQGKYRQSLAKKAEVRADVMSLAHLAATITDQDGAAFREFLTAADPHVADRLKTARKRALSQGHRLWLQYVTLGKCSPALRGEAQRLARRPDNSIVELEVFDGPRLMTLLRDYLDGVAPPIPTLDLEMEQGRNVQVNGVMQRFDSDAQIESWVFPMRGDAIADLFQSSGVRLFARNIRGFLGKSPHVNRSMAATLKTEPERFFYFNNGVTIVCDGAEKRSSKGKDLLRVSNPQIINGQQTTRMLALHDLASRHASVLVKVIQVPKDPLGGNDTFDELVSNIVAGTNWQNQIKPSDLRSNDRKQIELERALRKHNYLYIRKRQSKSEMKRLAGSNRFMAVTKEEFAQAVAGCDLDPIVIRSGKEGLFEEEYYDRIFPNTDPLFYLPRYRLMKSLAPYSRGFPERAYAKWLVLNFLWSQLAPLVKKERHARKFVAAFERYNWRIGQPLGNSINGVFDVALRYYRANRGKGKTAIDVSLFFRNKPGRHREFAQYWARPENRSRNVFDREWQRLGEAIETEE